MRTWRLLLVGFGNVGQGTAARLRDSTSELARAGCAARIVGVIDPICGNVARDDGLDPATLLATVADGQALGQYPDAYSPADALTAISQVPADVVFEMTPTDLRTGGVGLHHIRAALGRGRHVCTTNKGPVALEWRSLRQLATEHRVQLRCEGTVMSGTPVLNLFENGLAGAGVRAVRGVLNGTCNFMISEMEEGRTYDDALSEAQRHGYAETDPSGDVDGLDAAAKVAILANLVLGADIEFSDVACRGIRGLDATAVRAAAERGECWRLVGSVRRDEGGWKASVQPELLAAADPLATARGATNMLVFETDALGDITVVGPGAGREATGHALVADLLAIHRAAR